LDLDGGGRQATRDGADHPCTAASGGVATAFIAANFQGDGRDCASATYRSSRERSSQPTASETRSAASSSSPSSRRARDRFVKAAPGLGDGILDQDERTRMRTTDTGLRGGAGMEQVEYSPPVRRDLRCERDVVDTRVRDCAGYTLHRVELVLHVLDLEGSSWLWAPPRQGQAPPVPADLSRHAALRCGDALRVDGP
jgi:hypothetical protein